ncbi:MAG: hypothetical protein R3Y22_01365 [Bacteroidales bacterium]
MKTRLLTLVLVLMTTLSSSAASYVYLKEGGVLKGEIVSRDETKVVLHANGVDYDIYMEQINRIKHDDVASKDLSTAHYLGMIDVQYGFGIGQERNNIFGFETSFGYQFNKYFYLGGGLALNFHNPVLSSYPLRADKNENDETINDPEYSNTPFVPLYINVRSQLYESDKITPFIDLKVGSSVLNYVGLYLAPSIGVHFPLTKSLAINVSLGYSLQQSKYKYWILSQDYPDEAEPDNIKGGYYIWRDNMISNFTIKTGIEF